MPDASVTLKEADKELQHSRVATKKYHMSDFRSPYIPDHDRQELPNSKCLSHTMLENRRQDTDTYNYRCHPRLQR